LKSWLEKARLDPSLYGLHSFRRTFPTHIYQQTGNLRAAQLLLGHASIESTKEYIGTEQAEALEIARRYHLLAMQTYLEKRQSAKNVARFYRMVVLPKLFGEWTLYREWGRIGQGGKVRMDWFTHEDQAVTALITL
jgi:predicted DNA-binding WGR domain protein